MLSAVTQSRRDTAEEVAVVEVSVVEESTVGVNEEDTEEEAEEDTKEKGENRGREGVTTAAVVVEEMVRMVVTVEDEVVIVVVTVGTVEDADAMERVAEDTVVVTEETMMATGVDTEGMHREVTTRTDRNNLNSPSSEGQNLGEKT